MNYAELLDRLGSALLSLVLIRAVPMLAWFFVAAPLRVGRLVGLAGLLALVAAYLRGKPPTVVAEFTTAGLAIGYFFIVALGIYLLPNWLRSGKLGKDSAFLGCATVSLVIPALLFQGPTQLAVLVLGFEFMLRSFSYVVEVARTKEASRPTLNECILFLVVNPVLVYTDRGQRVTDQAFFGAARVAAGVGVLALYAIVMLSFSREAIAGLFVWTESATLSRVTVKTGVAAATLLVVYAVHSGIASVQIGLMLMLGFRIPERYQYPLASSSPIDWWRRWNTYVAVWFQRYVFLPVAFHIGRRYTRWPASSAKAIAVMATFGASGAIHELAQYCMRSAVSGKILLGFLAQGLFVLTWAGAAHVARKYRARTGISYSPGRELAARSVSWLTFVALHLTLMTTLFQELGGAE